jgi:hypothetical protein
MVPDSLWKTADLHQPVPAQVRRLQKPWLQLRGLMPLYLPFLEVRQGPTYFGAP